ncbi:hypothetical protein PGTUg99_020924 [Puccinia graminis f. sp. tritici]|uniref:Uncharacterized protein n=1 Tax=Puccinia graminis f. sp. tritici TaxID=56615 RepID=A0A5B0NL27_PUCGR|nr:hypothetical protein PGTUg99_020924 [Puccinia graminis f. sp. tritici]
MVILRRWRALGILLFCCIQANHYNAANTMELETEVLNRARSGQICLPGIQDLVKRKIPNIQKKQKEVWDYMATVPQFERQDSVFKQTGGQPRHADTSFGNWKQSK